MANLKSYICKLCVTFACKSWPHLVPQVDDIIDFASKIRTVNYLVRPLRYLRMCCLILFWVKEADLHRCCLFW